MVKHIAVGEELHLRLSELQSRWGTVVDRLSLQRVIELLVEYAFIFPPTVEFVRKFEFLAAAPGRPRRSSLDSPSQVTQPTVSEEQLDASEDSKNESEDARERGRDPDDHAG